MIRILSWKTMTHFALAGLLTAILAPGLQAGDKKGRHLMEKNDAIRKPSYSRAEAALVILRDGGREIKEFRMVSSRKNKITRMRISFTAPTKIEFLTHSRPGKESDQWIHLPGLGVRRVGGSDRGGSFVNSHFYYDDLDAPELDNFDYTYKGEKEIKGETCNVVRAVRINGRQVYSFRDIYLRKSDSFLLGVDFYEAGKITKRLRLEAIRTIQGYITPRKMVMERTDGNGKSIYYIRKIEYDKPVSETFFSSENL